MELFMKFKFEDTQLVRVELARTVFESTYVRLPKDFDTSRFQELLQEGELDELLGPTECQPEDDEIQYETIVVTDLFTRSENQSPKSAREPIVYFDPDESDEVIVREIHFDAAGNELDTAVA